MGFQWLRRRARKPEAIRRPKPEAEAVRPPEGPAVVVERLDEDPQGAVIIAELGDRYEISGLDAAGRRLQVVVDDAFEQDEAIVRLASQLDEIDLGWQRHLSWPRSAA